jgi:hypothetical protein
MPGYARVSGPGGGSGLSFSYLHNVLLNMSSVAILSQDVFRLHLGLFGHHHGRTR